MSEKKNDSYTYKAYSVTVMDLPADDPRVPNMIAAIEEQQRKRAEMEEHLRKHLFQGPLDQEWCTVCGHSYEDEVEWGVHGSGPQPAPGDWSWY